MAYVTESKIKSQWDFKKLPSEYSVLESSISASDHPECFTTLMSRPSAVLNAAVVQAIDGFRRPRQKDGVAVVKIGDNQIAAEHTIKDTTTVVTMTAKQALYGVVFRDGHKQTEMPSIPPAPQEQDPDVAPIYAIYIAFMMQNAEIAQNFVGDQVIAFQFNESMNRIIAAKNIKDVENDVFYVNNVLVDGFDSKKFQPTIQNGKIPNITSTRLKTVLAGGDVICGIPKKLASAARTKAKSAPKTVKEVKAMFADFAADNEKRYTDEEKALIREFPDDYPVVPEMCRIARYYVNSIRNGGKQFRNFYWRGITAYGKSTAVEMLSCVLRMPLVRLTCSSGMEAQDFLSVFIPDSEPKCSRSDAAKIYEDKKTAKGKDLKEKLDVYKASLEDLKMDIQTRTYALADMQRMIPAADVVECDPEAAYETISGDYVEGVSIAKVLSARDELMEKILKEKDEISELKQEMSRTEMEIERLSNQKDAPESEINSIMERENGQVRFKLVESPFVTGLKNGYIVEVQEMSRIKDAGTMVTINEYDRPGAILPLADGSTAKRHERAMVVFTDNIGYASCREPDPSVIRRMDLEFISDQLTDTQIKARVKYNTGLADDDVLKNMLEVWKSVISYCKQNDITESEISVNELERWASAYMLDDMDPDFYKEDCRISLVNKVSSDKETIEEVWLKAAEPLLNSQI